MDYEVFREVVSERIKDFLPPIFSSYKVKINTVRKVNEEKEALIMMPEKSGELTAMPNIYLDEMYEEFQKVEDLDVVLRLMAAMVISSLVGTLIPMFFHKIKIDPAVASGPLITTVNDLVAVVIYYGLVWILLIHFLHMV